MLRLVVGNAPTPAGAAGVGLGMDFSPTSGLSCHRRDPSFPYVYMHKKHCLASHQNNFFCWGEEAGNRNSLLPHFFNTVILRSSDSSGQNRQQTEAQLRFLKYGNGSTVRKTRAVMLGPDTGKANLSRTHGEHVGMASSCTCHGWEPGELPCCRCLAAFSCCVL